jgi:formate C-acetyltransferase
VDFYLALQDVLAGIRAWHASLVEHLKAYPCQNDRELQNRDRIIEAFRRVPFEPARSFFEAVLAYNFAYYLDDCDNPGRVDQELLPYYSPSARPYAPAWGRTIGRSCGHNKEDAGASDLPPPRRSVGASKQGNVPREEALALLERFADNVYKNWGWSESIGGTRPDGGPAYNDLTVLCIQAARKKARPSLQLRIREDMPDEVWDAALDSIASGNGLPALYNEEGYLAALRSAGLGIAEEDLSWWNGGGCTETMIHGRSNVGSLDAGMNLPLALAESLDRHLAAAPSFDALLGAVKSDFSAIIAEVTRLVSLDQETKARWRPQPMRTLLIDDCIDRGVEFHAGGARYNWSVINIAGLANVADSLAAIREVVFEEHEKTGAELLDILRRNFGGDEPFRLRLTRCPRFGNDDPRVDTIAADIAEHVFGEFLKHRPWRGGRFLPSCIMFVTYADAGARVGATPDGRRAGEPIADSIGPVQGRDRSGPTAMLRSVARLPHHLAPGTPVLNIRFAKKLFGSAEERRCLRDLIRTYFDLGGLQIQINVVDQAVLLDAIAHPERHGDLIVRVGGYSARFNDLPLDLKRSILERTEHGG